MCIYQGKMSFYSGYLSWMRNTYIMTVAGVAMLHSEVAPLAPIAGTGKHSPGMVYPNCYFSVKTEAELSLIGSYYLTH